MAIIKDIVERRVNTTGVSEPVVTTQGTDRVVVELPGVTDPEAVRQLVGQTGRLDFVPARVDPGHRRARSLDPKQYPPLFSGDQVASATVGTDQNGRPAVDFVLKDDGKNKFADYTAKNVGDYFAITLDDARHLGAGHPELDPERQRPDHGRRARRLQRQGRRPNLVTVLKFGSLPFPITALSSETDQRDPGRAVPRPDRPRRPASGSRWSSPSCSSTTGCRALVASFALIYYTLVMFAIFRLIPVTLTLAGIAGFVLSVGMAVDANILIFERMKEELRVGKSLPAAVEAGFNRAWNSILDSNVSSLITATILYAFGSSVIRGFALVLIIGVLVSMFSAIVVTRTILRWVVRQEWARKPSLYGLRDDEFVALGAVRPSAGARRARRV